MKIFHTFILLLFVTIWTNINGMKLRRVNYQNWSIINDEITINSPPLRLTLNFAPIVGELVVVGRKGCELPLDKDVKNKIVYTGESGKCSFQTRSHNCRKSECLAVIATGVTKLAGSNSLTQWESIEHGLAPVVEFGSIDLERVTQFLGNIVDNETIIIAEITSTDENNFLKFYQSPLMIFFRILFSLWLTVCIFLASWSAHKWIRQNHNEKSDSIDGKRSANTSWLIFINISEAVTSFIRLFYVLTDFLWATGIYGGYVAKMFITITSGWVLSTSFVVAIFWIQNIGKIEAVHLIFQEGTSTNSRTAKVFLWMHKKTRNIKLIVIAIVVGSVITLLDLFSIFLEAVIYLENLAVAVFIRGLIHFVLVAIVSIFFICSGISILLKLRKTSAIIQQNYSFRKMAFCMFMAGVGHFLTICGTLLIVISPRVVSYQIFAWAVICFFAGFQITTTSELVLVNPWLKFTKSTKADIAQPSATTPLPSSSSQLQLQEQQDSSSQQESKD